MSKGVNVDAIRASIKGITRALADKNVKVTQAGSEAFVQSRCGKPIRVNIPNIPDTATDELVAAVNGFLDHEVAHLLYTDFNASSSAKMSEVEFNIYNILEDTRIEREMQKRFVGSKKNLKSVASFLIEKLIEPKYLAASESREKQSTLFMPAIRAWSGQEIFKDFMDDKWHIMSDIESKIESLVPGIAKLKSTQDSIDLAKDIYAVLRLDEEDKPPASEDEPDEESGDQPDEEQKEGDEEKDDSEEGGDSEKDNSEKDDSEKDDSEEESASDSEGKSDEEGDESPDESKGDESESDSDDVSDDEHEDEGGESGKGSESEGSDECFDENTVTEDKSEGGGGKGGGLSLADEIDEVISNSDDFDECVASEISGMAAESMSHSDYVIYTSDGDVIEPFKVGRGYDDSHLERLESATKKVVGPLQKTIERLVIAKSHCRNLSGKTSGRVNSSSLYRLKTGNNRVFKQREEADSKDVAVSLVIDCSGSMMYMNKIDVAMQCAFALSSVLSRLSITNEVIGFTTLDVKGWHNIQDEQSRLGIEFSRIEPIYMPIFKSFDERLGVEQKKRMAYGAVEENYLKNNIDGESISIAAKRLATRSESGKKMFVLSDGSPAAYGRYGDINRHLKRTINDIQDSGIDVLGIGIMDKNVERFYDKSVVINDLESLPKLIMAELKSLLV